VCGWEKESCRFITDSNAVWDFISFTSFFLSAHKPFGFRFEFQVLYYCLGWLRCASSSSPRKYIVVWHLFLAEAISYVCCLHMLWLVYLFIFMHVWSFQWNYSTFAHWISMIMVINVHFYCPRLTLLIFFLLYFGFCFNFWSLSLFFWCCFYRHIYLFTYKHELIVWFKNLIKKATSKNAVHLSFCLRLAQDWETLKTLNSNLTSIICWLLEERNIAIAL